MLSVECFPLQGIDTNKYVLNTNTSSITLLLHVLTRLANGNQQENILEISCKLLM